MTAPNANTLWGRAIIDELAKAGVEAVCISPGSRSTPLTVAAAEHDDIHVYSHLDERSAAFFALGRARVTGAPTPLICTSGTAAANYHPAVVEASEARIPMLLLTADRPRELRDSGANQTIDQVDLYGSQVRWARDLPDPEADERKLRSLRTIVTRALGASVQPPAGPVHLNAPFRKPLEPTPVPGEVPPHFDENEPEAASGRSGPYVSHHGSLQQPESETVAALSRAAEAANYPLIVAGPTGSAGLSAESALQLADALEAPLLADPLSGLRYGPHVDEAHVIGGYDMLLEEKVRHHLPTPDFVIRFGASPTSKPLRQYLAETDGRQVLVDPAGGWREATFTATDLLRADPSQTATAIAEQTDRSRTEWLDRWIAAENAVESVSSEPPYFEGAILKTVVAAAPTNATLFVSNSMPVRDVDRFGAPRPEPLQVLGNRGASGIDGITSTALGAGSAVDGQLILVTGDIAYYHDMNGLLAVKRCDVDATIVLLNNDGGGIFHMLPIAEHETFETHFKTPHGLDFEPSTDLYGLSFTRVSDLDKFEEAYSESLTSTGTTVIEAVLDAEESHKIRDRLVTAVAERLR